MKKLLLLLSFLTLSLGVFAQTNTKITIESNDQMRYNLSEIRAKAGQRVTLTLKHTGKMPAQAMGHNLVILQKGTDVTAFANLAARAKTNNYIPVGTKQVIIATKVIGGGESTTVTFTAPAKGTYDFICSFPGHVAIMKGKFIVE